MNEYIKALNEFSEDQFAAFLMGVGVKWLNLPYWGIKNLEFQCDKIEEYLASYKKFESEDLTEGKPPGDDLQPVCLAAYP